MSLGVYLCCVDELVCVHLGLLILRATIGILTSCIFMLCMLLSCITIHMFVIVAMGKGKEKDMMSLCLHLHLTI
jgi:hypothetical protein